VKKKLVATTITISMLMLSAIAGTQFPNFGVANPYEAYTYTAPPIIEIHSPLDNETVYSKNVPLNLTITKPDGWGWLLCLSMAGELYSNKLTRLNITVDGNDYESVVVNSILPSPFSYSTNLTNLAEGIHNLTIHAYCDGWDLEIHGFWHRNVPYETSSNLINFAVDALPLELAVGSPENKVYNVTDIPLTLTTTEPVSWMSYSLDDGDRITISRNITLTNITFGSHRLTIFANDTLGNWASSKTINFTIQEPPEPFPTTIVIASVVTMAVVSIGLIVYFKKRKH
jgi:hypothetical protein